MKFLRCNPSRNRMDFCSPRFNWFQALVLLLSLPVALVSTGCGGTATLASNSTKTLSTILITPGNPSVVAGTNTQLTATGTYSDGSTADVTTSATWSSSSAAVATVSASGLAAGVAAGNTTITATMSGINGTTTVTVTAAPKTLASIAISPATVSIIAGATQQFTATGTYGDGSSADVTLTVTWTVANAAFATINSSGLATGVAAGSTTVTAALSGVDGTAALAVTPAVTVPTLSSIAVSPGAASIAAGVTQQFTATATYSDGSTANVSATASWTAANAATATINSSGLVTGVAPGTTTITASLNGVTGTASLAVTAKTVTSIAVSPTTASVAAGNTQQFTATATYSDGSTGSVSATVSWTVANKATATINSTGLATGVAPGTTTIIASLNGVNGTASLTVTAKILTAINVSPATPSIPAGDTQQFTATATYSDGSTANVSATAGWTVANGAIAKISSAGLATGIAQGSTTVTASLSGMTGTAVLNVTAKVLTAIAVTPSPASVAAGATQQFAATATYSDGSTADITSSAAWATANSAVATINSSGLATGVAAGTTTVSASLNSTTGNSQLTVGAAAVSGANITTWHVDNNRSGLNSNEQLLSPSNVSSQSFGKLFSYLVDGYVYGEPLLVSNVVINGSTHNVLYAATENDSVYAFDADNYGTGAPLWQVSLLNTGETPLTNGPIQPLEGVTSTPVIDLNSNTIYVVSAQRSSANGSSFRLNALDITTGAPKFGGPVTIQASVPATNSDSVNGVEWLTTSCIQRAALLLAYGNVYMGFGSCHSGWLLAYDAQSLTQTGVFNASPNLNGEGTYASAGGVWMGGGGPVADGAGNVYVTTGNGPWDGQTAWADSVLKFSSTLQLQDYFTPNDYQYMDCNDADLASGGLLLIPGTSQLLAGGKTGKLYMVNSGNLGQETATDSGATQTLWFEADLSSPYSSSCTDSSGTHTTDINSYEIFGTSAYFNGSVYLGITPTGASAPAGVRQFIYSGGQLTPGPYTTPSIQENTRGTTPFISANGSANGILWMIDTGQPIQNSGGNTPTSAALRAYDATNFPTELYSSAPNSGDTPGYGIKFTSPIVANGKVYISTGHDLNTVSNPRGELDVYGLK